MEVLGHLSSKNQEAQDLSFAEFLITDKPSLEVFDLKLNDKNYQKRLAAALRFSIGSSIATKQNVNYIMAMCF